MKGRMELDREDAFEQFRAELAAVEPSGAFAAGVRERVAAEPAPRINLWLIAVAGGTLVLALGVVSWRMAIDGPSIQVAAPAVVSTPALPPVSPAPPHEPVRVARPVRTVPLAAAPVTPTEARLEVLVPPDEALAMRQLLIAQRRGRGVVPAGSAVSAKIEPLPDIRAIEIAPIQIPLLSGEGKDK
jgi:hypothetical protein